eukprot:457282-Heterocapsa_arctica.AAC.2
MARDCMGSLEAASVGGMEAAVKTVVGHLPALSGNHARPLFDSPEPRDTEFVIEGEALWVQSSHFPKATAAGEGSFQALLNKRSAKLNPLGREGGDGVSPVASVVV